MADRWPVRRQNMERRHMASFTVRDLDPGLLQRVKAR